MYPNASCAFFISMYVDCHEFLRRRYPRQLGDGRRHEKGETNEVERTKSRDQENFTSSYDDFREIPQTA